MPGIGTSASGILRTDDATASAERDEQFEDREIKTGGGGEQNAGEFFRETEGVDWIASIVVAAVLVLLLRAGTRRSLWGR